VLPFDLLKEAASNKRLYVPAFGHWSGINDQLAFGCGETINALCSIYNALPKIAPKVPFRSEDLLHQHIKDAGLELSFFDTDYVIERAATVPFEPKVISPGVPDNLRVLEAR
jgi:hypothetical protein